MTATHPSSGVAAAAWPRGERPRRSPSESSPATRPAPSPRRRRPSGPARSCRSGVPSSFQAYDPHPIVVRHAAGLAHDRRRRQRVRRLRHGLRRPVRRPHAPGRARRRRRPSSTTARCTSRPCELNAEVAELLRDRYGLPMWRFTNSGTEATMDAVRVARGATGRDKIVKVEGGYHGHHDELIISMKPSLDDGRPGRRPALGAGDGRHHVRRARRHDRHPVQRPRCARAGARRRRRRLLHRRAGDGEHRHLPARARLPRGGPRASRRGTARC